MTEIIKRTGNSSREAVFQGEMVAMPEWGKKIIIGANKVNTEVLAGSDPEDGGKKFVSAITGGKYESATDLLNALAASPKDPELIVAKEMIAQSVFLAMRDGGDVAANAAVTGARIADIEARLPDSLRGLAREVRDMEVGTQIGAVLDDLDQWYEEDIGLVPNPREEIKLLEAAIDQLDDMRFDASFNPAFSPAVNRARRNLVARKGRLSTGGGGYRGGGEARIVPPAPWAASEGGEDADGGGRHDYLRVTEENFTTQLMAGGEISWNDSDPPQWFLEASPERQDEILVRLKIHNLRRYVEHFVNDFEKIRMCPYYVMTENELNAFFDGDTKLAGRMMYSDLYQPYQKENGVLMFVYKLDPENGYSIHPDVARRLENITKYKNEIALRLALTREMFPGVTASTITPEQMRLVEERAAVEIAKKEAGQITEYSVVVTAEDRDTAYSMWEAMYAFHQSTIADRNRMHSPISGVIGDKVRYYAEPEVKIERKTKAITTSSKFNAAPGVKVDDITKEPVIRENEPKTPTAKWAQAIIQIEDNLGKAITGRLTMRERIATHDFRLGPENLMISMFDMVSVDVAVPVDAAHPLGVVRETIAEALAQGHEFTVGPNAKKGQKTSTETDELADFRDAMEATQGVFEFVTGKKPFPLGDAQKTEAWQTELDNVVGLWLQARQERAGLDVAIASDGTSSDWFWANVLWNSVGIDGTILASSGPTLRNPFGRMAYGAFVEGMVDGISLLRERGMNPKSLRDRLGSRGLILSGIELFKRGLNSSAIMNKYRSEVGDRFQAGPVLTPDDLRVRSLHKELEAAARGGLMDVVRRLTDEINKIYVVPSVSPAPLATP